MHLQGPARATGHFAKLGLTGACLQNAGCMCNVRANRILASLAVSVEQVRIDSVTGASRSLVCSANVEEKKKKKGGHLAGAAQMILRVPSLRGGMSRWLLIQSLPLLCKPSAEEASSVCSLTWAQRFCLDGLSSSSPSWMLAWVRCCMRSRILFFGVAWPKCWQRVEILLGPFARPVVMQSGPISAWSWTGLWRCSVLLLKWTRFAL